MNIIKPKQPKDKKDWEIPEYTQHYGFPCQIWRHKEGHIVFSTVEVAKDEHNIDIGPEYHVSISLNGGRCSSADALWILNQFDMVDADEDNHVPAGIVRNFWKPVNENLIGRECPCKKTEPAIKENKGDYVWRGTNK